MASPAAAAEPHRCTFQTVIHITEAFQSCLLVDETLKGETLKCIFKKMHFFCSYQYQINDK